MNPRVSERTVACRLAMLAGTSGPLSWENEQGAMPIQASETEFGFLWFLGNGFSLAKTGPDTYTLSHATAKIDNIREFIEWIFEDM